MDKEQLERRLTETDREHAFTALGFQFNGHRPNDDGWISGVKGPPELGEGKRGNFAANVQTGGVKDFGSTGYTGDLYGAVQDVRNCTFPEALQCVAKQAGVATVAYGSARHAMTIRRQEEPPAPPKQEAKGIPREDVERWTAALLDGEKSACRKARTYLTECRGIDPNLLRVRRVGVRFDKGLSWIVFPNNIEGGRVTLTKERAFDAAAMDWKRNAKGKAIVRTVGGGSCLAVMADDDTPGPLLLCEGETDGFSARSNGFNVAFGTAGADTFKPTWAEEIASYQIAKRGVVILYDGDAAGRGEKPNHEGRKKPARILAALNVEVRIGEMPDGEDVNDVLREGGREALQAIIEEAMPYETKNEETESAESAESASCTLPWRPFPTGALPSEGAEYVSASAAALNVDPAMVAVPMLAALASGVGNSRRVELKRSWEEPSTLWTCIVSRSGTLKSPALDAAVHPVYALEAELRCNFETRKKEYDALSDEERSEREKPVRQRLRVGDTTVESVALVHSDNPRGLALIWSYPGLVDVSSLEQPTGGYHAKNTPTLPR